MGERRSGASSVFSAASGVVFLCALFARCWQLLPLTTRHLVSSLESSITTHFIVTVADLHTHVGGVVTALQVKVKLIEPKERGVLCCTVLSSASYARCDDNCVRPSPCSVARMHSLGNPIRIRCMHVVSPTITVRVRPFVWFQTWRLPRGSIDSHACTT